MVKKTICILVIILLLAFIFASILLVNQRPDISHITAAQRVAEFTKPAVVRIIDGAFITWRYQRLYEDQYAIDNIITGELNKINYESGLLSSGSGAVISPDGYIVTNAHVVSTSHMEDDQVINQEMEKINSHLAEIFDVSDDVMRDYLKERLKVESFTKVLKVVLPGGELVDGEIKSFGAVTGEGKDVAVIKIEGKNLPCVELGNSDKVSLQESIWVFGYPAAADSDLLSNDSILVVSITEGKISATDKKSSSGAPVFQIDAAATHGNSGGPVVKEDGTVIGLLTFRSEQNNKETQGFNFVVPVNTVKEFVNQAGAKNEQGDVDRLYKEGLVLYWGGYYKDALGNFEAIQRLYANHSEVKKLISECQQKLPESKILWAKYKKLAIGLCIVAFLIIIALIYFAFFMGKKHKAAEATMQSPSINAAPQPTAMMPPQPVATPNQAPQPPPTPNNTPGENTHFRAKLYGILPTINGDNIEFGGDPVAIGRDPRVCQVVLDPDNIEIARKHCVVNFDREKKLFEIEDCGSTGGTFLSTGERLAPNKKYYLKSGDSFYLGSEQNQFEVWLE